ncbi:MAG: tctC [Betaproteobacteria bacterium]|nr:tctC [Betaproteobacteria bacterium]
MTAAQAHAAIALLMSASIAAAQTYPNKPIRIIVPLAAGGTGDTLGRLAADALAAAFGQQVVVDNRPGANGIIGTDLVAKATPDGYTLASASTGNVVINPALFGSKLPFNAERDLVPITQIATGTSVVIVHPSFAPKTISDLIALAKAKPAAINYASSGMGSAVHLGTALFESMAGIRMTHIVYKGSTPGRVAVLANEADLMFDGLLPTLPQIKAGKLRALGVTSIKRSSVMPDVPAISETLPGYSADTWYGLFAPRGTPREVILKIHATIAKTLATAETRAKLAAQGAESAGNTPEEFAAFIKAENAKWGKVVRDSGAKPD